MLLGVQPGGRASAGGDVLLGVQPGGRASAGGCVLQGVQPGGRAGAGGDVLLGVQPGGRASAGSGFQSTSGESSPQGGYSPRSLDGDERVHHVHGKCGGGALHDQPVGGG